MIWWGDCLFPIVYSYLLCHRLADHISVSLFLVSRWSQFCFIDLCAYLCASTILLWLLYFCSKCWNQGLWYLQLCSFFFGLFSLDYISRYFSRLLLFRVFCGSIQVLLLFYFCEKYCWGNWDFLIQIVESKLACSPIWKKVTQSIHIDLGKFNIGSFSMVLRFPTCTSFSFKRFWCVSRPYS